jgi:uncharacterized protein (TIGR03067 family)
MRRVLPLVLLSLAFAPAPFPKPHQSKEDLKKLQGLWMRKQVADGGRLCDDHACVTLEIIGQTAFEWQGGKLRTKLAMRLDATQHPRCLDFVVRDDPKGNAMRGIYRINGETFTYCYREGRRPTTFDPTAPDVFTAVFKR